MNILQYLWALLVGSSQRVEPSIPASRPALRYSTAVLSTRDAAMMAAARCSVVAIAEPSGRRNWALVQCPCGRREILSVNLRMIAPMTD